MFEAVVTLCATLAGASCRDALLPGYEAGSHADCVAALAADPPAIAGAVCRPAGPALDVTEIAPGVFVHRGEIAEPDAENGGDVSNLGFVIGSRAVAVIDSGSAAWMGEALYRAIRARSDLPVAYMVLTHMHPDHVLGASVFSGAEVIGHANLARALAERRDSYLESFARLIGMPRFLGSEMPHVDRGLAGAVSLDLGGRMLELQVWPTAHTSSDLTAFDRATGTFFAGDLVFDAHAPALDGSLRGWQTVLDTLQDMAVARLVPGHGGPVLDWPEGGAPLRHYLEVLAEDTRAAIAAGERLGEAVTHIAESEAGAWALFEAYNARNATVAFTELEWE
ncbi:quinoprotein relay system zinc metallohydrolase 2 [Salipiger sp. P9]|uniref:quinoprotein relay system zinc metallohydrolase 2 n=1 Tax=Salipiger pentaromativorans TaxID=2943193 RepID=UPI002157A7AB|nr:quinoprotein relay system zinc metallohydrolase 2 [Salipiger pentaromativorans]MCR8548387.1 quinoprotein relay system zinc metallohydrolase 2 [Salipiger pentaromativorans]